MDDLKLQLVLPQLRKLRAEDIAGRSLLALNQHIMRTGTHVRAVTVISLSLSPSAQHAQALMSEQ